MDEMKEKEKDKKDKKEQNVDEMIREITDALHCCICADLLYEPVVAPCGHNICDLCSMKLEKQQCPECRCVVKAWKPSVTLRKLINTKSIQGLYQERNEKICNTPEYRINKFKRKFPDTKFGKNNFSPEQTADILQFLDENANAYISTHSFPDYLPKRLVYGTGDLHSIKMNDTHGTQYRTLILWGKKNHMFILPNGDEWPAKKKKQK